MSDFYLESYLHTLLQKQYSIFIVEGAFPPVDTDVDVQGRGRWFDSREVIEFTRNPARRPRQPKPALPPGTPAYGPEADLARALAASMQQSVSGGSTVWRGPTYTGGGGSHAGHRTGGDEEDDLRRALAASMEDVHPPAAAAAAPAPTSSASPPAAAAVGSGSSGARPFINPAADPATLTVPAVASTSSAAAASSASAVAGTPSPAMLEAGMQILAAIATAGVGTLPVAHGQAAQQPQGSNANNAIAVDDEDDEEEMRRAIEMSMQP